MYGSPRIPPLEREGGGEALEVPLRDEDRYWNVWTNRYLGLLMFKSLALDMYKYIIFFSSPASVEACLT